MDTLHGEWRLGRSDVGLSGQNEVRKGIGSLFYWWYCGVHNLGIHSKGIIEVMEKYHAEALIPFVILLAIFFTMLKIRDNKRHRREELFRDSMAFFAGATESQ